MLISCGRNYRMETEVAWKDCTGILPKHFFDTACPWCRIRILCRNATFRKNNQNLGFQSISKQWLKDAAYASQEIIDSNHYSLHSTGNPDRDYGTLFVSENPVSWEIMWANL